MGSIVRCIDHLVVPTNDVARDTAALAGVLGLDAGPPTTLHVWFTSAMFFLGNVWLEVGHFRDYDGPLGHVQSIAFEPSPTAAARDELARRGIAHNDSKRADGPMGWTTTGLPELLDGRVGVFLCEYHFDRTPDEREAIRARFGRVAEGIDDRRRWARDELRARTGGALGIDSVFEVTIATPDLSGEHARWPWQSALPWPRRWPQPWAPPSRPVRSPCPRPAQGRV